MVSQPASLTADFATVSDEFAAFLANPGHFQDPYPLFKAVRDVEPVHWSKAGVWLVLGHPEARQIFKHEDLSRAAATRAFVGRIKPGTDEAAEALETFLNEFVHLDDPEHARVRALVSNAFRPAAVKRWEEIIDQTVANLVADLRYSDHFDLLHDFAYIIPSRVICEMVGVPFEDHRMFEQWTTMWLNTNLTDPRADVQQAAEPLIKWGEYLRPLIAERRESKTRRDDLVSLLIDAEENGDRLSERELVASLMLLIVGGHETTANLISNGTLALLRHADQMRLLQDDPSLIPSAVEEFLRYESPARSQARVAVRDVQVGNKVIRAGDKVQVHAGAINRDGRVFSDPDTLDIRRDDSSRHLAFGLGAHFCLGVHVARLEARKAFHAITQSLGQLELAGPVEWRNGHVRALVELPVKRV